MSMMDNILEAARLAQGIRERRLIVLASPDRVDAIGDALANSGQAHLVDLKASPLVEGGRAIVIDPRGLWS